MIDSIILVVDYKGFFSSKQKSEFYRGGLNINRLVTEFSGSGYDVKIMSFNDLFNHEFKKESSLILYMSSEDDGNYYKAFIEDIIFHFEQQRFHVLPCYAYLKAHNNKVSMELLRKRSQTELIKTIDSQVFGTLEELKSNINRIHFPAVIKPASGAMSKGVSKASNAEELKYFAGKISRSLSLFHDLKELLRKLKYRSAYKMESFYRSKFIVQNLISGLDNDWKVLVYGKCCFVLYRGNRENDFRASGSGKFEFKRVVPDGLLDYAFTVKKSFKVPHISLDIGYDGSKFHLIEFQFVNFGTTTIEKSPFYFKKTQVGWDLVEGVSEVEKVYAASIIEFLSAENNQ